jgi:hypothetical protein
MSIELSATERYLLGWLSMAEFTPQDDCACRTLDGLLAKGLVQLHPHYAVSLTVAGKAVAARLMRENPYAR